MHLKQAVIAGVLLGAGALGAAFYLSDHRAIAQMIGHGGIHAHRHGADGTGHDEAAMPGLRGLDATELESEELAVMFRNFQTLRREVDLLPNGIRTVTSATDPDVMAALISHVVGMIAWVEEGRDPQIAIQSRTLDIFFERPDAIETEIEMTEAGIVVVQTSDDPEMVAALHVHAAEVSDMAERGMQAVHEKMMQGG
ncbi:hypothetical protein ROE7235_01182 [Roseibaca ekhonensis]|jgi:hypothetical protein|uniref:Uncharacterized protein n=1 Tax=Roseinatronobacter ekhonensis TaxID=254356 RepID=A0A3B0MK34_9RHOB|nr:hypothetical protein [Roseibaca ekhonensis]SUZ31437.1 hypothetical protein ROE7235_01182 [Roseibaca ekhonensis]